MRLAIKNDPARSNGLKISLCRWYIDAGQVTSCETSPQ